MIISARERSTVDIGEQAYRRLEASPAFWDLVEQGVLTLVRGKTSKFGLRASAFVGQFSVDQDCHLQVSEKIPGAVAGLIRWSAPADLRTMLQPSLHGDDQTLLAEFASRFLSAVGRYVSTGRRKQYVQVRRTLATPRGSLDIKGTIRLWGRGERGRLACRTAELSADLDANQIIGLALSVIEPILDGIPGRSERLTLSRIYAPLFEDVGWRGVGRMPPERRERIFRQAFEGLSEGTDLHVALSYARALILHLGAWVSTDESQSVPHSYFLSLETLFEGAVRQALTELLGRETVARGSDLNMPLFAETSDRYIVDPDIVVRSGQVVTLVADCKYKELADYPTHADLYQLIAHAQATGAGRALLILPGTSATIRCLGRTESGIRTFFAEVRPETLAEDLEALLEALAGDGPATRVLAA